MTFLDAGHVSQPFALDPNRNDAIGMALSAVLPVAAMVAMAGLNDSLGAAALDLSYPALPFVPADWHPVFALLVALPMWGLARWAAWQAGDKGRAASWWMVGLIGLAIAYPYLAAPFGLFWQGGLNLLLLGVGAAAAIRVAGASRAAFLWLLPPFAFFGLAAVQSAVLVTGGWSPGFAVILAGGRLHR